MKHTKGIWYPIQFAGWWTILNSDFYDGLNLLNADDVGEKEAEANAQLAAQAPILLELGRKLLQQIEMNDYSEPDGHHLKNNKAVHDLKAIIEKLS